MAQSIPSVPFVPPGYLSFCFGKAANASRWDLAFKQKPHALGLKKVCKRPTPGQHQNNRPLPGSKNPHFQNEARCTTFLVKTSFICMRMKNDFHIKGWAPTLVLRQRHGGTQKWPTIAFLTPKWCSILKAITSYFDVKGVHSALVWKWKFLTSLPGLFVCPVGDEALRVFQELGQCVYWFSRTVKEW